VNAVRNLLKHYVDVHAYVVIHLCDSMWSFWVESNFPGFFYHLFIYVLLLEIQLSRGGWDPIIRFDPVTYVCLSQSSTWISSVICRGFFYVQWAEMRCDHFSFCWNSWPSLFKLSFYKLDWAWNKGYLEIQLILSYTLTYTSKLKWGPFENETIRQKRLFQFFHYELSI
jgi:hypothetical protein